MPVSNVSFDSALCSLASSPKEKTVDDYSTVVSTSLGLTLIEIQGDLSLPKFKPDGLNENEEKLFEERKYPELLKSGAKDMDPVDAVKFGRLEIDPSFKKATLFISTTQRLIGTVEKVDPPLGVLKIDHSVDQDNTNTDHCEIIDVIKTKIIFKQRPLPIM